MGNISSLSSNNLNVNNVPNLCKTIDNIAAYYILTSNYKSLKSLGDKLYCNKLVNLLASGLEKDLNDIDIMYLNERIHNGAIIDDTIIDKNELLSGIINIDALNIQNINIDKKIMCIEIAKFYVKIAHIYSSIFLTINPVYTYEDVNGKFKKAAVSEKDNIPKEANRQFHSLNVCNNKLVKNNVIKKGGNNNSLSKIFMESKECNNNLNNELKIQEILDLYLDSNYDYEKGKFLDMSEKSKNEYNKDLNLFYVIFSGNNTKPEFIHKFSDIKLLDYDKNIPKLNTMIKNNHLEEDNLFAQYAYNMKQMIQKATENQNKLLDIINELFVLENNVNEENVKIKISPFLKLDDLNEITKKTSKFIIDLYINCELDYIKGAKIFEAIVSAKILETTKSQIDYLEKEVNNFLIKPKYL